jgi:hypothetical protein
MINPYFCYALSFLLALVIYPLRWSTLYPSLSLTLAAFLVLTILIHSLTGYWFIKKKFVVFKRLEHTQSNIHILVTIFIYLLWTADFIYEGGIPLVKILLNQPYNYQLFGLPSVHVFIVTFSSFYTVYLAHVFLSGRKKIILVLYMINLFAAILIYNRGMFAFNLAASFFLFSLSFGRIPRYFIVILPVIALLLLFIFGFLGTLRESRQNGLNYDNSIFLTTGKASESFIHSAIPKEYFWGYIYITSPIANLQQNINTFENKSFSPGRLVGMVNNEILMDFISKRINTLTSQEPEMDHRIVGPFNVSTVYSRCYSYLGWSGIFFMGILILAIPLMYRLIVTSESPFYLTGMCILSTMFLFLAFDNTIRFTGFSFQLVYPVILTYAVKRFQTLKMLFA